MNEIVSQSNLAAQFPVLDQAYFDRLVANYIDLNAYDAATATQISAALSALPPGSVDSLSPAQKTALVYSIATSIKNRADNGSGVLAYAEPIYDGYIEGTAYAVGNRGS